MKGFLVKKDNHWCIQMNLRITTSTVQNMYVYIYTKYVCIYIYIYIYMHICRERERERERQKITLNSVIQLFIVLKMNF